MSSQKITLEQKRAPYTQAKIIKQFLQYECSSNISRNSLNKVYTNQQNAILNNKNSNIKLLSFCGFTRSGMLTTLYP